MEHRPTLVHFGDRHAVPAEVCWHCSDPQTGRWVPVTDCPTARTQMTEDARSLYAAVIVLDRAAEKVTRCPQCGANDGDGDGELDGLLDRWHDPTGSGWQCLNPSCQWHGQDDEIE